MMNEIDKTIVAVVSQMLSDDLNVAKDTSTGSRVVTIGTDDTKFKMELRWRVSDDAVDLMEMGIPTWSARVRNAAGRSVMYVSSMTPATSAVVASMIRKHLESKVFDSGISDWNELSEYGKLEE
jgi:hypothetical protein